jgi:hypothetical protein
MPSKINFIYDMGATPVKKTPPKTYMWAIVKPKDVKEEHWDNAADKYVGKMLGGELFYQDPDYPSWYCLSFNGDPFSSDATELCILESIRVRIEHVCKVQNCNCPLDKLSSIGCKCGGIISEKKFRKILHDVQK